MTGPETMDAAAVVARFNRAWNDHDLDAALALTAPDVVFEATSPAPDGARHVGREAVRAAWQPIFADGTARIVVEDGLTCGPVVVQRWRYDWDGGHVRGIDVIRVVDGMVAEKLSYVKG